jgi:hypothetical protein
MMSGGVIFAGGLKTSVDTRRGDAIDCRNGIAFGITIGEKC